MISKLKVKLLKRNFLVHKYDLHNMIPTRDAVKAQTVINHRTKSNRLTAATAAAGSAGGHCSSDIIYYRVTNIIYNGTLS